MRGREPADDNEHTAPGRTAVAHHQPAERVHNVHGEALQVHSAATAVAVVHAVVVVIGAGAGSDARAHF